MSFVSSIAAGQFVADGPYYTFGEVQPAPSLGPNSSLCVVVGGCTDGPVGVPVLFSGSQAGTRIWGNGTRVPNSLMRSVLNMTPELTQFVGVRETDGTDSAAVINQLDAANATLMSLVAKNTGSNANLGSMRCDLQNGALTASPVMKLTFAYPNKQPETFANIIAYATPGGGFDPPTYRANAAAAVNGTIPNTLASQNWVALAIGGSSGQPQVAATFQAAGGTDGTAGLTDAILMGQDGSPGTGMYAARGTGFAGVVLAGFTTAALAQTGVAFVQSETPGGFFGYSYPIDTTTAEAETIKIANSLQNSQLLDAVFWDYVYDAASGQSIWVPPIDKVMAIVLSQPTYLDPSNKPYTGAVGISATERTYNSSPVNLGERGQLQTNGTQWLSNANSGSGGLWKLPHGLASDGSNISDTRMKLQVAADAVNDLGQFIGEMQAPDALDDTSPQGVRFRATAALNARELTYVPPAGSNLPRQLVAFDAVCDLTTNTLTTVQQGFLIANIYGTTLTGVKFALAVVFVGNTVTVQTSSQIAA